MVFAEPPPRRVVGRSRRDALRVPRRGKLTPDQQAAIRSRSSSHSLRALAAEFGVSHETARAVARRGFG